MNTLIIRKHADGLISEVYHVRTEAEALRISANAYAMGFKCITLEPYQPNYYETNPEWRMELFTRVSSRTLTNQ